jgi:thiamine transport system ATP-binding protein
MTTPGVAIDGLTVGYDGVTALEDVSLTVEDGEFFTLVGPSGCGKTTTLRAIAGLESPDRGTVSIGGRDVTGKPPEDRDTGIVFQNYALFPHMSVAENVGYGLRFAEPPGGVSADERVAELLGLVGLDGFGDRDPTELSGGQQQRVALARALAPGPDVLLLDEPMSALDARLRERLRRDVRDIQQELGVTTVYVTHDQAEAMAVSDRVAVMHDGRVEQVGEPRDLYRRPRTRFVAEFLGENNVFDARVVTTRRGNERTAGETEGLTVRVGDVDFVLSRVEKRSDDRLTFCVRPAALEIDAGENRLTGEVVDSEFLGETTRVWLEWEGRRVVAALEDPPETGSLTVGFDPGDAWVLDA